jgi:hypothetical protein
VREERGVEVERGVCGLGPCDPVGEVFRAEFVARDFFAVGFGVERVEPEALGPGDEREGLFDVAAEFLGVAGLSGVVARCGEAAVERAGAFEAGDVVTLPAVDRQRHGVQGF